MITFILRDNVIFKLTSPPRPLLPRPAPSVTTVTRLPVPNHLQPPRLRHPHRADGQRGAGGGDDRCVGSLIINNLHSLKKNQKKEIQLLKKCVSLRLKKIKYEMAKDYPIEDTENQEVNEPQVQYVAPVQKTLRTLTDEEIERSMTLEELDTHLTELIHQHYHNK